MKHLLVVLLLLCFSAPGFAQGTDEAASRDDVIFYLRTMRSNDMLQRTMQVQAQSMQQLFRDMLSKEGKLPADFDTKFKAAMDDLIKNMPSDEIMQAMIPAYQNHFTKGDLAALNAFYSSPVGQKVLHELPSVLQEGNQAAMPVLSRYLEDWQKRMKLVFEQAKPGASQSPSGAKKAPIEN